MLLAFGERLPLTPAKMVKSPPPKLRRARAAYSEALLLSTEATGDRKSVTFHGWKKPVCVRLCEILHSPLDQGS